LTTGYSKLLPYIAIDTYHSGITIFDKSKDKKIKTIKEYTKSTIQNKLFCDNKVNKSNTPCFLSHFHFATTDPNADRGCKNKFI